MKNGNTSKLKDNRIVFKYEHEDLKNKQATEHEELKKQWAERNEQRVKDFAKFTKEQQKITGNFETKQKPESAVKRRARELAKKLETREQFHKSRDSKDDEPNKNKDKSKDGDNER